MLICSQCVLSSLSLSLNYPELYPENAASANAIQLVGLLAKIASAAHPAPNWSAVAACVLAENAAVAKLVLLHFGAFSPAVPEDAAGRAPSDMTRGCGQYACQAECLSAADVRWPQAVGTGVMKICMVGFRNPLALARVLEPLLRRLKEDAWDSLYRSRLSNARRPVVFQALVELIQPYLWPVTQSIFDMIEAGKAWTAGHVPTAMREIVQGLQVRP